LSVAHEISNYGFVLFDLLDKDKKKKERKKEEDKKERR